MNNISFAILLLNLESYYLSSEVIASYCEMTWLYIGLNFVMYRKANIIRVGDSNYCLYGSNIISGFELSPNILRLLMWFYLIYPNLRKNPKL